MFHTGLVSVTFRQHTPEEIAAAAQACGLQMIEWGSDVHVPQGSKEAALSVKELTRVHGLCTSSYGSYYRLGVSRGPAADFSPYLQTAVWLGAPVIRIWGGNRRSADLTDVEFSAMAAEAAEIADMAAPAGIRLALECHPDTLTDDWKSSLRFLDRVNRPNLAMYWQPNQFRSLAYNLRAAEALAPYTANLHVFSWSLAGGELKKYPLKHHAGRWEKYLDIFRRAGGDYSLLLEFMHDGKLASLPEAAETLAEWVG